MIHVSFGLYDKTGRYSKFVGTTMLSLFENTTAAVTVHLLHDHTLTSDNREKFLQLAARFGQAVKFYNVENFSDKLDEFIKYVPNVKSSHLSVGTIYRFLLPQILSPEIKKLIYLDADIIVTLDLNELWQIDLGEKILAAVPEILSYETRESMNYAFMLCAEGLVAPEDYFNGGVLLINPNLFRAEENAIKEGLRFHFQNPKYQQYFDQDILNYCFAARALKLPAKFNRFVLYARRDEEPPSKKIYHYSGGSFGYGLTFDPRDPFNRLWMKYFVKSPWFNEETLAHLYESFMQARTELKKSALKLSAQVSGKSRIFLTNEEQLNLLLENFSVREDEDVFTVADGTALQKIIDVMNAQRGKGIFFFLLPKFPFDVLEEAGFVRGEDFLDGFELLPLEYNFNLPRGFEFLSPTFNSYSLVKAL